MTAEFAHQSYPGPVLMVPPDDAVIELQRVAIKRVFSERGEIVGLGEMSSDELAHLLGRLSRSTKQTKKIRFRQ